MVLSANWAMSTAFMSWASGRMWLHVGSYEYVGSYDIDTSNGPTSQDDSTMKDQNASLCTL